MTEIFESGGGDVWLENNLKVGGQEEEGIALNSAWGL